MELHQNYQVWLVGGNCDRKIVLSTDYSDIAGICARALATASGMELYPWEPESIAWNFTDDYLEPNENTNPSKVYAWEGLSLMALSVDFLVAELPESALVQISPEQDDTESRLCATTKTFTQHGSTCMADHEPGNQRN